MEQEFFVYCFVTKLRFSALLATTYSVSSISYRMLLIMLNEYKSALLILDFLIFDKVNGFSSLLLDECILLLSHVSD